MLPWRPLTATCSCERIIVSGVLRPQSNQTVIRDFIFASLAGLSFLLLGWQWLVARRFPLHLRLPAHSFPPAVTLLKPLKGCEPATEECLHSWFAQEYTGRVQLLFGVASMDDPVCGIVRKLQHEFPEA